MGRKKILLGACLIIDLNRMSGFHAGISSMTNISLKLLRYLVAESREIAISSSLRNCLSVPSVKLSAKCKYMGGLCF